MLLQEALLILMGKLTKGRCHFSTDFHFSPRVYEYVVDLFSPPHVCTHNLDRHGRKSVFLIQKGLCSVKHVCIIEPNPMAWHSQRCSKI